MVWCRRIEAVVVVAVMLLLDIESGGASNECGGLVGEGSDG